MATKKTTKKTAKTATVETPSVEEPTMLVCSLTGKEVPSNEAFSLTNHKEEEVVISLGAAFTLATTPAILNAISLNKEAYEAVIMFRKQAEAKQVGVNEGANKTVELLKQKAAELGLSDDLDTLVQAAFAPPTAEVAE